MANGLTNTLTRRYFGVRCCESVLYFHCRPPSFSQKLELTNVKPTKIQSRQLSQVERKRAARISKAMNCFVNAVNKHENTKLKVIKKRPSRKLITAKHAGRLLGLSPKTLANWRNLGSGPTFHKLGGKCLYSRQDVLSFARDRKFASTSAYSALPQNGGKS